MKYTRLLIAISILALLASACVIVNPMPRSTSGAPTEVPISIDVPSGKGPVNLNIKFPAGSFELTTGSSKLVEGMARFTHERYAPVIEHTVADTFTLRTDRTRLKDFPSDNESNTWNLILGNHPLNLSIEIGAYDGKMTFDSYALQKLEIREGASRSQVKFTAQNKLEMESFSYQTGASNLEITGVGYTSTSNFKFEGGAGNYRIDFSGDLTKDLNADVRVGLGATKLIFPADRNVIVDVTSGLNSINTVGSWSIDGKTYSKTGNPGPTIKVFIESGAGTLDLIAGD